MQILRGFLLAAAAMIASGPAVAGTIRADVPDSAYLQLGQQFASVGKVTGTGAVGSFPASATVIAPNWALTAAHVTGLGDSFTFEVGGQSFTAAAKFTHPEWNPLIHLLIPASPDVGLLYFDTPLPVAPMARYTGSSELGQVGTIVGFGRTGNGLTGATLTDGLKRAGQNRIDLITSSFGTNNVLLADFDAPGQGWWQNTLGSVAPEPLEFMLAAGDSGGGMFINEGGNWLLAGVNSFLFPDILHGDVLPDADYGDLVGFARVSTYNGWIDSVISGESFAAAGGLASRTYAGSDAIVSPNAVPEPATWAMLIAGFAATGAAARGSARRATRTQPPC